MTNAAPIIPPQGSFGGPKNFAITGVAGYIAPRHLKAIKETGNTLVAATDPHDSVGILDSYFADVSYFREFERFDRFLEKLRRKGDAEKVHYLSICSPNYLHDAHIRLALRVGADAICEKPLVLNPWNLEALKEIEKESGKKVFTILQLRLHPAIVALKEKYGKANHKNKKNIVLTYVTSRGPWYQYSWKGDREKAGGLSTNIGIHFFDMLLWTFGHVQSTEVHLAEPRREAGFLELEHATVQWFLSIDSGDLPFDPQPGKKTTYRSMSIDGEEFEFSDGFADLHTSSYREILSGKGFGLEQAFPSVELVHKLRNASPVPKSDRIHPMARKIQNRGMK